MMDFTPPTSIPGACDCHLHVVGPKTEYPLAGYRAYTPMDAPLDSLMAMHRQIGMERLVLVQISVYGYDNSCMLDALERLGVRARGIAIIPEGASSATLDMMHRLGVRGLRVNIATYGSSTPEEIAGRLETAARQCDRHGWHVQLFAPADVIPALEPTLTFFPTPVVIDHFGLIPPQDDIHPAETVLRRLLEKGQLWVKISGAYRLGDDSDNDYSDPRIGSLARRLYKSNPDRILWGTDWPHSAPHGTIDTNDKEVPYRNIDNAEQLRTLNGWFDDPAAVKKILAENPVELYGF